MLIICQHMQITEALRTNVYIYAYVYIYIYQPNEVWHKIIAL